MKKQLWIYGAGGLGREILSMVRTMPEWEVAGFIDDKLTAGTTIQDIKVTGGLASLHGTGETRYVILAFGDPNTKSAMVERIQNTNVKFPVLIHPRAILQHRESINIGEGSIVAAGCILTTDIIIGKHVLINLNATIGHDCIIGNYSSVMPGVNLAGGVEIENNVLIGSGSNIRNKIRVSKNSTIGMGSVVIKDVPAQTIVAGVPAKALMR